MSQTRGIARTPAARRDYYEVLGLPPQAGGSAVSRAYWQLARRYQALASSEPSASAMLEELNEAAEVLSTPALRRQYEALRQDPGITPSCVGPQEATTPPRGNVTRLRRLCTLALMIVLAGAASAPAIAGANGTKTIPGPAVTSAPIIFVGDSITEGAGATSVNATFAQLMRQRLDDAGFAKGPGDYDSVISALGGQFVDLRFSQDVGRQPRSLVVVEVGAHSVVLDQGLSAREFGIGYGLILDCLQGSGGTVVVSTIPWLGWDQADPLYARAEERSEIIRWEAGSRGIPVADLWNGLKDRRDLLALDEFHPNDAGHRLIADLFWAQIEPQLGRPRDEFHDRCGYDHVLTTRALDTDIAAHSASGR